MNKFIYSSKVKIMFTVISFIVVLLFIVNENIVKNSISYKENNLHHLHSREVIMNTNYFEKISYTPSKYFIENYKKKYTTFTNTFDESFINISRRLKYKASIPIKTGEVSVVLYGMEKDTDYYSETLKKNTVQGFFLDDTTKENSVAISMTLAKKLGLSLEDKIIIRLIGVDNFYKASEYLITAIIESENQYMNDNVIFMAIEDIEKIINKKNSASEINISYLQMITNENIKNQIANIFGEETKVYKREDIYPYIKKYKEKMGTINIYINIALCIILFASYLFLYSKYVWHFKKQGILSLYLPSLLYTFLGYLLAILLSRLALQNFIKLLNTDSINYSFSVSYALFLLINISCITLANILIYLYAKKSIKAK